MLRKLASVVAIILMQFIWLGSVYANDAEAEIKHVMIGYEQAWSHHDAKEVAQFYHEPAKRVNKAGPTVRNTIKDQKTFFEGILGSLVARGYDHSDWESLNIHLLDARTAVTTGITLRYRKDGSLMERTAVSYGLWKTSDGWKIFWSATHEPEGVMQFN